MASGPSTLPTVIEPNPKVVEPNPTVIEPIPSAPVNNQPGPGQPTSENVPNASATQNVSTSEKAATSEKTTPKNEKNVEPSLPPKKEQVSVSQLKFWIDGDQPANSNTTGGGAYLSYTVFLALSVLGGFLALDHLYLRSPFTFLAKIGVNLLCFGIWWIWDVCQAIFNEPVVRSYGLGIPGYGPHGIGAGVLASDEPGKKHLRFFMYGLAVTFGGLIGLDSFLVGETETGLFRLIATLTVFLMPLAALEWGYKLYQFFFDTKGVVEEYALFFGASSGKDYRKSGLFRWLFGDMLGPIFTTIDGVSGAVKATAGVVTTTIETAGKVADTVKEVVTTAKDGFALNPAVGLYGSKVTSAAIKSLTEAKADAEEKTEELKTNTDKLKQEGGKQNESSSVKILPYTLVGTLVLIVSSGIYKNFYSTSTSKKDDPPPKP
jgi:hypothetical protein